MNTALHRFGEDFCCVKQRGVCKFDMPAIIHTGLIIYCMLPAGMCFSFPRRRQRLSSTNTWLSVGRRAVEARLVAQVATMLLAVLAGVTPTAVNLPAPFLVGPTRQYWTRTTYARTRVRSCTQSAECCCDLWFDAVCDRCLLHKRTQFSNTSQTRRSPFTTTPVHMLRRKPDCRFNSCVCVVAAQVWRGNPHDQGVVRNWQVFLGISGTKDLGRVLFPSGHGPVGDGLHWEHLKQGNHPILKTAVV